MTTAMPQIKERNAHWFPDFVPAHEIYLSLAEESTAPGSRVLHLGAGRDALGVGKRLSNRSLTAVDRDPVGLAMNPCATKFVADAARLPFPQDSFELILCEHVFEHLEHPVDVLTECARVLKPHGKILFLTPNRFSYIALASAMTPYRFHVWYKSWMTPMAEIDTFPTYYRINSRRDLERVGESAGLRLEIFRTFVGWPTYLERNDWLHRFGVALHWLLERGPSFFHISLVGALAKGEKTRR